MKKLILFICFILISSGASAQLVFEENFDYPVGDSIGAHGWIWNTGTTNTIKVVSPGLTYAGYPSSGIGNATYLNNNGNDAYKGLNVDSIKTGSVYASCLVKVDTAKVGDYFFALLQSGSNSFYEGRLQVRSIDGSGNLSFGITKGNASTDTNVAGIWTPHVYSKGVTYLIVLKYTFIAGSANDAVSLFVFDSGLPAVEPAPTIGPISAYTSADASAIGRVALRQGTTSRAPSLTIDGIRVSTSWFSTILNVKFAVQGIYDAGTGTHTVTDSATVYVRSSVFPYPVVGTYYSTINASTLTASFLLSNSIAAGNYYLDVRYRHSEEFRNGINTWSSSLVALAPYSGNSYDFTTDANKAYGDNQIQLGTKFATYNGDINQDETVDAADLALVENSIDSDGYRAEDVTGDDYVDATDVALVENNAGLGVYVITP